MAMASAVTDHANEHILRYMDRLSADRCRKIFLCNLVDYYHSHNACDLSKGRISKFFSLFFRGF